MEPQWIRDLPKINLHCHLEGSIRPSTFWEEARRLNCALPAQTLEDLLPYIQYREGDERTLVHFLSKFRLQRQIFTNSETISRIVYEALEDDRRSGSVYTELRFNPTVMFLQGMSEEEIADGVRDGIRRARTDFGIASSVICGIMRDRDLDIARRTARFALRYCGDFIVGMDLFSDETFPLAPFAPLFRQGMAAGLHLTIHAGEAQAPAGGAENIKEAIQLGAERIGHGVRILESPDVLSLAKDRGVLLEMCPTSNVQTGAVDTLPLHPMAGLFRSGIPVCVNTDDPQISGTTLLNEYAIAHGVLGLSRQELRQMGLAAAERLFDPSARPQVLAALRGENLLEFGEKTGGDNHVFQTN